MAQPSLYARYLLEREDLHTLEEEYGFASYKFGDDYVYITDIYVLSDIRQKGLASALADKIAEIASKNGKTRLIGSVDVSANNCTESAKALLGYGFKLHNVEQNLIYFVKEIA